ncbi:MAG: hypothetical protein DRP02_14610, partial [Candidatus Gerdarchaeota archaeon]
MTTAEKKFVMLSEIAPNPDNPREFINADSLVESIKTLGLQNPLTVRHISKEDQVPSGVKYIIVDGDCRFDALCLLGPTYATLEVGKEIIIKNLSKDDAFDINVSLNLERNNYSLREECNIIEKYQARGLSQREIAKKCNRSQGWVQDRLRLLAEPQEIQARVFSGEMNLTDYRTKVTACSHPKEVGDVAHLDETIDEANPQAVLERHGTPYIIDREAKKELEKLLETDSSTIVLERETDEHIYVEVDWASDNTLAIFEDYLAERKQKEQKELNRSLVSNVDLRLIFEEFGIDAYSFDLEAEAPEGFEVIVWLDLVKKEAYDSWTKDDRIALIKKHLSDDLSIVLPKVVYDSLPTIPKDAGIIEVTSLNNEQDVFLLFWSFDKLHSFEEFLLIQEHELITFIDRYEVPDKIRDTFITKTCTHHVSASTDDILFFYEAQDAKDFAEALADLKRFTVNVTAKELAAIKKHLPDLRFTAKSSKVLDHTLLFDERESRDLVNHFLSSSRSFHKTKVIDLPTQEFISKSAQAVDIPFALLQDFYKTEIWAPIKRIFD